MIRAASTLVAFCLSVVCAGQTAEHSAVAASETQANSDAHPAKRPVTTADSIQMTRFGDPSYADGAPSKGIVGNFSPNGERFVVVLKRGNLQDNTNEYSLVLFRTAEAFHSPIPRVLVSMFSSSNRPAIQNVAWMDDNDTILFLGEHPGEQAEIYSIKCRSGELKRLSDHPTNLTAFASTGKGDRMVYVAEAPATSFVTQDALRNGIQISTQFLPDLIKGSRGADDSERNIFVKELGEKEIRASIHGWVGETEPTLSPDGKHFVVQAQARTLPSNWSEYEDKWLQDTTRKTGSPGALTGIVEYELVDTNTGASEVLLDTPIPSTGSEVAWSADSQSMVVSNAYLPLSVDDPAELKLRKSHTFLVEINIPRKEIIKLSDQDLKLVEWNSTTNTIVCEIGRIDSLTGKPAPRIYFRKNGDKWSQVDAPKDTGPTRPSIVLEEEMNTPPRIFADDPASGRKSLLMDLNPQFSRLAFAKVEEVKWKDTRGKEVTGGLYWPPGYVSGKKYPLVIQTHGFNPDRFWIDGPWTSAFAAQALAGENFFVLQIPDPDWHLIDTPDEVPVAVAAYEGAIDYLDQRSLIDRNLVGIIGYSRTCIYVTHMLAFSKYRIAAAVIADGAIADYFEYFSVLNVSPAEAEEFESLYGGAPFGDALSSWIKQVPTFHLDQVQAPVRIQALSGPSALLSGAWAWFTGLSGLGKPVEMVYLPDATHILEKPWERMVSQQGDVDWFCFWLKGEEASDPAKAEQYKRWRQLRALQSSGATGVGAK